MFEPIDPPGGSDVVSQIPVVDRGPGDAPRRIALNVLTLQEYRLGMALAFVCFALTFASHDFKGRARR